MGFINCDSVHKRALSFCVDVEARLRWCDWVSYFVNFYFFSKVYLTFCLLQKVLYIQIRSNNFQQIVCPALDSKLSDTVVSLKELHLKKLILKKDSSQQKYEKLPSMQRVKHIACQWFCGEIINSNHAFYNINELRRVISNNVIFWQA